MKQIRNPVETNQNRTTDLEEKKETKQNQTKTARHAKQNQIITKQKDNNPRTRASHAAVQHQLMGLEMMA